MSDLCGRTIKVSLAQQNQLSKLSSFQSTSGGKGQAIWSSDQWFQEHVVGESEQDQQTTKDAQQDKETLRD